MSLWQCYHYNIYKTSPFSITVTLLTTCLCSSDVTTGYSVFYNKYTLIKQDLSSSQTVDLVFLYFTSHFYFYFILFFYFLFLEQLGLGWIGHTVTSITIWWRSHKTDHKMWENLVEDLRIDDIIQHKHYMLASWTTHGRLG